MFRKQTAILLFLLISFTMVSNHDHFPEEFTPMDMMVVNSGEKLLMAYYMVNPHAALPATLKYDYRNGVLVYPYNDVK
jgi:hypothetical protein